MELQGCQRTRYIVRETAAQRTQPERVEEEVVDISKAPWTQKLRYPQLYKDVTIAQNYAILLEAIGWLLTAVISMPVRRQMFWENNFEL